MLGLVEARISPSSELLFVLGLDRQATESVEAVEDRIGVVAIGIDAIEQFLKGLHASAWVDPIVLGWPDVGSAMDADCASSCFSGTVYHVRPIQQAESERLVKALKTIASYRNPAVARDGAQAAADLARQTLDDLDLFEARSERDASSRRVRTVGSE
jgi:hypothetical protein